MGNVLTDSFYICRLWAVASPPISSRALASLTTPSLPWYGQTQQTWTTREQGAAAWWAAGQEATAACWAARQEATAAFWAARRDPREACWAARREPREAWWQARRDPRPAWWVAWPARRAARSCLGLWSSPKVGLCCMPRWTAMHLQHHAGKSLASKIVSYYLVF